MTFDCSPIGAAIVDVNFKFSRVNQELCRITGYSSDELTQLDVQRITYPDDLDVDLAQARRLALGEINDYSIERRYVRKDGSLVWVHLAARIVRDDYGQPLYFIALVEDIHARKLAEARLAELAGIVESTDDAILSKDLEGVIISWNRAACAARIFGDLN